MEEYHLKKKKDFNKINSRDVNRSKRGHGTMGLISQEEEEEEGICFCDSQNFLWQLSSPRANHSIKKLV
jgi:hypothetical protein